MLARKIPHTAGIVLCTALLSACAAKRDSFTVGSIPSDYRTNHPISIAEEERTLDVPVASNARTLSDPVRSNIRAFAVAHSKSGSGALYILTPSGSPNASAAHTLQSQMVSELKAGGISAGSIVYSSYDATQHGAAAPVRLSYREVSASTGECGKWNDDMVNTAENRNYSEFGCATQKNMAAVIENPGDLLGPRAMTPIDAANRGAVIEDYQGGPTGGRSEVEYTF